MNITERQKELRKPFTSDRIEWRLQSCGKKNNGSIWAKCLAYIDNRAAMERLDAVYGEAWSQHEAFTTVGNAAVCTVHITIAEDNDRKRTVTGSCAVEANGDIDQFKSAASGAMKRAVVNLGVGRYLYDLPEAWAEIADKGQYTGKTKDGTWFKWNPPALPSWALPEGATVTGYAPQTDEPKEDEPAKAMSLDPKQFKPNPNYKGQQPNLAQPASGEIGDPWAVVIHFGKNKGVAIRDLSEKSLSWYRDEWQPEPYKGKMSADNIKLRTALDMIKGVQPEDAMSAAADQQDATIDEVPF